MAERDTDRRYSPELSTDTAPDRRRPGRPDRVSPELIPLLRGAIPADVAAAAKLDGVIFGNPDQLRAMTGVLTSLGISSVLWFSLLQVVHHFVR